MRDALSALRAPYTWCIRVLYVMASSIVALTMRDFLCEIVALDADTRLAPMSL